MVELSDTLLQRFIAQQDEVIAGYRGMQMMVTGLKLNQRRLRNEVRAIRSEVGVVASKLASLKADGIVLNSTLESIEEWAQKVDQKLEGVYELAKSSYDMSESALKRMPHLSNSQSAPASVRPPTVPPKAG